jgi:hypothetical protein
MTLERTIAQLFRMDDATWMRHANPWSVILRNTALPALIIAFWSRLWLGWWAVIPVALALLWTWYNPRIFPAPAIARSLDFKRCPGRAGLAEPQCCMVYLGKLWFLDRMVWLWNDLQDVAPEYQSWRIRKEG